MHKLTDIYLGQVVQLVDPQPHRTQDHFEDEDVLTL